MNTTPHATAPAPFPMRELEQIEQALISIDQWADTLRQRKMMLTEQLDRLTSPDLPPSPIGPRVISKGFEWRGTHVRCWHDIDVYTGVLQALWEEFPDKRDAMAAAASRCGSYRRYIATSIQALFPGMPLRKAARYARRLVDGWYVDTNLNWERKARILPEVTRAAGLAWGLDVKVYWKSTAAHL